jgi:hypothetical protein
MFNFPTITECKTNKQRLIENWTKDKPPIDNYIYANTLNFYRKCYVFHHFIIPDEVYDSYLMNEAQENFLLDGIIKSSFDHGYAAGATLDDLDKPLELDRFVFFSFGSVRLPTADGALIFATPLQNLLDHYNYPDIWSSWGDIFTYAIDLRGTEFLNNGKLTNSELALIIHKYRNSIILPEDIPDLAAIFTISQCRSDKIA